MLIELQLKACLNSAIVTIQQNVSNNRARRAFCGKEFHKDGATMEKALCSVLTH